MNQQIKTNSPRYLSKTILMKLFKSKNLKVSGANNHAVISKIESYLKQEAKKQVFELSSLADKYQKKILTLSLATECFNLKQDELKDQIIDITSNRIISFRQLTKIAHEHQKKVSAQDETIKVIALKNKKSLLLLLEKLTNLSKVMRKKIITEPIVDIAIESVES